MSLSWKDFIDRYGTNKTNNFQLLKWAKDLGIKNFRYVMRDELFKIPTSSKNIVMNLDSSENQGTHHVVLYNTPDYKLYFSSFGDPPPTEVIKFLDRTTTTAKTVREFSDTQNQEFGSSYCGQLSIFLLYKLNNLNEVNSQVVNSLILELKKLYYNND
jgi:hypothetical protein